MTAPRRPTSYKENEIDIETEDSASPMKWLVPLLVAVALIVGALFLVGVFDADVDVDSGDVDIEAPAVNADVDADLPDVDVETPDIDVDPGAVEIEGDPNADAEAN